MSIAAFIRDSVMKPRLKKAGSLVVYDPASRYRDLVHELDDERVRVIDASESSIESRCAAIGALREVGRPQGGLDAVLIYVPAKLPQTDEQKQVDPFSIYGQVGAVFPQDDGDDYLSLCLRAKPDQATEIRKAFAGSSAGPSFAVIDAIGGGANWPQLRAALSVHSAREILTAFLAPTPLQSDALKRQDGWVDEARAYLLATLGLGLKTRAKSWSAMADEVWRYVLFSEFVFDLPVPLPQALADVPHAPQEAKPIIEDVCENLRTHRTTSGTYIARAEAIEKELNLAEECSDIEDLGERDTFPFEERTFLRIAIRGITTSDTDRTRQVLSHHKSSVWVGKGESQAQWALVSTGLALVEACEDHERQLPAHARSQSDLIDFYLGSLREADRLQREFEQAVGDFLGADDMMHDVIRHARSRYWRLAERVQSVFMKHLETTGWPPDGRLANADVYDRLVADRLKESGRRVAYLMVDALRYELGVALEQLLAEDGPVELQAAYAQLPTITLVGMASLLPKARSELTLELVSDTLTPKLAGDTVGNVPQRMQSLRKRLGDRFAEMQLDKFVRTKPKIEKTVDLLVLRSTEIDSQLENNPETTLSLIPGTLKLIRVALQKLREMGFTEAVIVTDHGFFLNAQAEAGDVCVKPQGHWPVVAHDRVMLGNGSPDTHNVVISTEKVGIRGDFEQAAFPRSMAPYRSGHLYFHGGASLAEAVVPVLIARLDSGGKTEAGKVAVELSYKNGAKRITTRVPVVDVELRAEDMFSRDDNVDVLVEAQDSKGNVVGEARPGGPVNPATGTVTLTPRQRLQIALKMDPEFEGKFSVKALNPTTLSIYDTLNLETDYTV
ncbi:PglZ domain-containing protein [Maricaulis sp.]|uniref:PglZ domain-containing protein n=1 Tax=Maricaulis sp. TaxID=1486257 RepID=UPI003A929FFB